MHSFLILGIVLFKAIVKTAPITDGINPDGTTSFIADQLDSELNFQPLPKIVTLDPAKVDPGSGTATNAGSNTQHPTPKTVVSAPNSKLNPYGGNGSSPELAQIKPRDADPMRDYFRENDFQCPKNVSFIRCCDGGNFDQCEACKDSLLLHAPPEFSPLIVQNWSRSSTFIVDAKKSICKKSKNVYCCLRIIDIVLETNHNVSFVLLYFFLSALHTCAFWVLYR